MSDVIRKVKIIVGGEDAGATAVVTRTKEGFQSLAASAKFSMADAAGSISAMSREVLADVKAITREPVKIPVNVTQDVQRDLAPVRQAVDAVKTETISKTSEALKALDSYKQKLAEVRKAAAESIRADLAKDREKADASGASGTAGLFEEVAAKERAGDEAVAIGKRIAEEEVAIAETARHRETEALLAELKIQERVRREQASQRKAGEKVPLQLAPKVGTPEVRKALAEALRSAREYAKQQRIKLELTPKVASDDAKRFVEQSKRELQKLMKQQQAAMRGGGGGGGGLEADALKGLKKTMDAFRGGGIVAGAVLAAGAIRDIGNAVADARAQLDAGVPIDQVTGDLLRQIPVLGQFTEAWDAVRNAITGEGAAIAKLQAEADNENLVLDVALDVSKALRDVKQALQRETIRLKAEAAVTIAITNASSAGESAKLQAQAAFAAASSEARAAFDAEKRRIEEEAKKVTQVVRKSGRGTVVTNVKKMTDEEKANADAANQQKLDAALAAADAKQRQALADAQQATTSPIEDQIVALREERLVLEQALKGVPEAVTRFNIEIAKQSKSIEALFGPAAGGALIGLQKQQFAEGQQGLDELRRKADDFKAATDRIREITVSVKQAGMDEIAKTLDDLRRAGKDPVQIKIVAEALDVERTIGQIKASVGGAYPTKGLDEASAKLLKLVESGKIPLEQFNGIRETLKRQIEEDMQQRAKSLREGLRSEFEKLQDEIRAVQEVAAAGLITDSEAKKAVAKLRQEFTEQPLVARVDLVEGNRSKLMTGIEQRIKEQALVAASIARQVVSEAIANAKPVGSQPTAQGPAAAGLQNAAPAAGPQRAADLATLASPLKTVADNSGAIITTLNRIETLLARRAAMPPVLDLN